MRNRFAGYSGRPQHFGDILGRFVIVNTEKLLNLGICQKGRPVVFIQCFKLGKILPYHPNAHAVSGQQTHRLFHHGQRTQLGHFIQHEEHRTSVCRFPAAPGHGGHGHRDPQTDKARVAYQILRRNNHINGNSAYAFEIGQIVRSNTTIIHIPQRFTGQPRV